MAETLKVLALDASTKTGFAFLHSDGEEVSLLDYGLVKIKQNIKLYGTYPWSYVYASRDMAKQICELVEKYQPDVLVIEETNLGTYSRYSQKVLEYVHLSLLLNLEAGQQTPQICYLSTSEWRHVLGLTLSKEDKANNKRLKTAKEVAELTGTSVNKKSLGVIGKVTPKHLAIRYVNKKYGLELGMKDNDKADAICIGTAYFLGAQHCDGE